MRIKLNLLVLLIELICVFTIIGQPTRFLEVSQSSGIGSVPSISSGFGHGAAAADFDNDGDVDFYLTTDKGINDRIYVNDGNGVFDEKSNQLKLINTHLNRSALWFDFNGDGLLDIITAGENCAGGICKNPIIVTLFKQESDHSFTNVTEFSKINIGSEFDNLPFFGVGGITAGDLTGDGYLDLVLTVWGGGLKIWINNKNGTFEDATNRLGFVNARQTFWQAMLHDFNNDGLLDIYCNVDFGKNKLWINKIDHFTDEAETYGLQTSFNEMGMCMGDINNDGLLDIYLTNITRDFNGSPQYNILYRQEIINSKIKFRDVGQGIGVSQSGWDWGCTFSDINNDGRQDILTTNGWNNIEWHPDPSHVWLNTSGGFDDVTKEIGISDTLAATTYITFDIDEDGDLDILQTLKSNPSVSMPLMLYKNQLEKSNFINIVPRMAGANSQAIGAVVTVISDNFKSSKLISAGTSFYGQEPAESFFGLGARTFINEVKIKWPDNKIMYYQNPSINEKNIIKNDLYLIPPKNLEVTILNGNTELTWEDNSDNEYGFILFKSLDSIFSDPELIFLNSNRTTFTDSFKDNLNYYYKVRAHVGKYQSDNSNVIYSKQEVVDEPTGMKIFPNPNFKNNLNSVIINNDFTGPIEIMVYDLAGKLKFKTDLNKEEKKLKYDFPLDNEISGLYFIQVICGDTTLNGKLIIH